MQRYRINYNWLIGVVVGGMLLAVAAFFVHRWQVTRNADTFITRAEKAEAEEDWVTAFEYYRKYVQLRSDDEDARIKMGDAANEVLQLRDITQEKRSVAYTLLDQIVRKTDDASLRRKLAEFVIGFRPQAAIGHLEDLLVDNPTDPELNSLLVRAYYLAKDTDKLKEKAFELIGYNREKNEFEAESSASSVEPDVFTLLANALRDQKKDRELARQVIDRMTDVNPDSAQAHLSSSIFWRRIGLTEKLNAEKTKELAEETKATGEREESKSLLAEAEELFEKAEELLEKAKETLAKSNESLNKAYELDPVDARVLQQLGYVEISEAEQASRDAKDAPEDEEEKLAEQITEHYSKAKTYFATGLKEHPEDFAFYQGMASAHRGQGDLDAALSVLDEGLAKFNERKYLQRATEKLSLFKIDLLLNEEDYAAIEEELERLTFLNRPDLVPVIDLQRARILYKKQRWVEAARELKRVRPLLLDRKDLQISAGAMLGFAYEKQGIRDLALDAYKVVLNDQPNHTFVKVRHDRLRKARLPQKKSKGPDIDQIIEEILALPEAEQDWSQVDKLVKELAEKNGLSEAKLKLLRARILIKRGAYADAQALIREAAKEDPDDIDVHYAAILLVTADPERGPSAALKLLDKLEKKKKWGVTLRSRTQRADLLARLNGDDLSEQLRAIVASPDEMTEPELAQMYTVIGSKFEQVNKIDEAREFWKKARDLRPNNLPILMHLFGMALREQDDASIQEAQDDILKLVQSKDNPSYILVEIKRLLTDYGLQKADKSQLAEGRKRLDVALRQRPEWDELHVLYGQLLLIAEEDTELAMSHFDDAIRFGSRNASAISLQVRLLAEQGLYSKALERMEMLPVKTRGNFLGRLEAEILNNTGDVKAGFIAARKLAKSQPNNPQTQVWFARIASGAGELNDAIDALKLAMKADNTNPDQWIQLAGYYTQLKDIPNVESTLRSAHLAVDAEYLPLLTAKYYELQSRWQNAERIYLATYAGRFDELAVAHRMSEFYLRWATKDPVNNERAAQFLNRILKAAYTGEATWDNPSVVFARWQAARLMANERDYQMSLKAEKLLLQGTTPEALSEQELLQLVDILVFRGDPPSLLKAKEYLLVFQKQKRLQKKGMLQLANLLSQTNEWDSCQSLMLEAISKYRSDISVWSTYIDLLIERGEYSNATTYVKRLRELNPNNPIHVQYSAKIAAEQGDTARLRKVIRSLVPNLGGALTEAQLQNLLRVSNLATQYGDNELAEKVLQTYEKRKPDDKYPLTSFLALHGNPEQALGRMRALFNDDIDRILRLATTMNSSRRDEFGDKYDDQIDAIIDAALRDDPDSITRQLARAEAYEAQEKNEESIAAYDKILSRDDMHPRRRAAAMNNLGFQLALLNQRVDDAEQLINDAIETFGPVSDMLDTRAIVYIAQKRYDLAIEDLELATSVDQDPVKFYHLAKAYIRAGEGRAAQKAWKAAQDRGFEKSMLPRLEKPDFDATVQQIENFQLQSAKL